MKATLSKAAGGLLGSDAAGQVRTEWITPDKAREYLALNTHNRNIAPQRVERLAGAMQRDEWVFNGEPYRFSRDGFLEDGQHRLLAIVKSGCPQLGVVVEGLATEAQETIDIGAKRTLADMLRLRDEKDVKILAGALGYAWRYKRHGTMQRGKVRVQPTPSQLLSFLDGEAPALRESIGPGRKPRKAGLKLHASLATALHYLMLEESTDDGEVFWARLVSGEGLLRLNPIFALRELLIKQNTAGVATKRQPEYLAAVTIKAFNAWRRGNDVQILGWRPGGSAPENFPTIEPGD